MLLNLNKIFFLFAIVFFVGCSSKYDYNKKSYHSSSYSENRSKIVVPKENGIKNSKAMHRATMRPYVVFGKKYHPTIAHIGDDFNGVASWYGPNFHAKKTSNGEIYDMHGLTAAHKTLPMNTIVKVLNKDNGKSVVVRINDRGPFVKQRIIDLSNKAAHQVDMVKKGTANVKVTVLGFNGKIATTLKEKEEVASLGNYYVQVGVFSKSEGANITKRKFELILEKEYSVIIKDSKLDDRDVKRVWVSGFRSENEAIDFKESNSLNGAMIIGQ
ncbi:MAG: septal ring lytic transglycosylase RlpA family protein [Campylobacterota bacterium]|nr:septal ring lytic transglycosylase RlpA family protein [Campylobacterota bacterium]